MKKGIYWFLAGAALVLADQLTKWVATVKLAGRGGVEAVRGIFEFYYTTNTGAAFSSFEGQRALLIAMPLVMMIVLGVFLYKTKEHLPMIKLAIMMIIAGGMGNLIDRIFYGYVVDFINFTFIEFPVFNLADIFVCVGGALLVVYVIFYSKDTKKGKNKNG